MFEKNITLNIACAGNRCNLDTLLIHLRSQVTSKWYELGVAIGMDRVTLNKYSKYPSEECIIEVLDYWLRSHEYELTWGKVADILEQIDLHELAENILNIDKPGMNNSYNWPLLLIK